MHVDFPWNYDNRGHLAQTSHDEHVRDMLELLLFTDPGERVNRPGFGCGARRLVFAPNSPELAAAVRFTMQSAIDRELGHVLRLGDLQVDAVDSVLSALVQYEVTQSGTTVDARLERDMP